MKVFRYIQPYDENGKPRFKERNKPGVYIIKKDGVIVYVGVAEKNVYGTMYRHFQSWNSKEQETLTYIEQMRNHKFTVRIILTTPTRAVKLEIALINKYQPQDNILGNEYGKQRRLTQGERLALDDYLNTYAEPPPETLFL